jgi:hypothetical protein
MFRYEMIRKDEFLNKCMYFRFLDSGESEKKIRVQVSETEAVIADFIRAYEDMKKKGFDHLHLMIIRYCIMNQETRLAWLKEMEKEFSKHKKPKKV